MLGAFEVGGAIRLVVDPPADTSLGITFNTDLGQSYHLERATDLGIGDWTRVASDVTGTGGPVTVNWGFPHGLIMTPVQIGRNLAGLCGGPDPSRPSETLRKITQINLGQQIAAASQQNKAA